MSDDYYSNPFHRNYLWADYAADLRERAEHAVAEVCKESVLAALAASEAREATLRGALRVGAEFQRRFDSVMADENDGEFRLTTDADLHNANVAFRAALSGEGPEA